MTDKLIQLYVSARIRLAKDDGQDLIEYALVVALIAFAATAGMGTVATGINDSFSKIASKVVSAIA